MENEQKDRIVLEVLKGKNIWCEGSGGSVEKETNEELIKQYGEQSISDMTRAQRMRREMWQDWTRKRRQSRY